MTNILGIDIDAFFNWVAKSPPPLLACVGTFIIGVVLKRTPRFPNDMIPVMLVTVVCPALYIAAAYGWARFYVEAIVFGGVVVLFHRYLWKRICGMFGAKIGFDSNPEAFKNPKKKGNT